VLIFDAWREFEEQVGDDATREEVNKNMPRRVKKQRKYVELSFSIKDLLLFILYWSGD